MTDAAGGIWNYTYDANNNMLTIQDARRNVYQTNQYDSNNRVIKQTMADGAIYQFAYTVDINGNITATTVTDPRGNIRIVNFNANGYVTSETYASGKPEQQTVTYQPDSTSNFPTSMTDALNRTTNYVRDANGNLTSVTRLAGTPQAVTTSLTFEPTHNQVATITDALSHTTTLGHDGFGNVNSFTDPLQHQTTITYDTQGRPLTVTDPLTQTTQFAYDPIFGDLQSVTDPLNRTVTRFSDSAGRLVAISDPSGKSTRMVYNALNKVTSVTDALGNLTTFGYDPNGNLLNVTDALNHQTQYTYENMDRVATRKDPLLNQESYQYDLNGNLSQFTDRRGKVTAFSYDALNRRTFTGYGMTAGPAYESTVSNTYDAGNRLTQVVDSISGTITRSYDGLDRLGSDATPQGTVGYNYDNAGRRASLTVPGQTVVNYTFDDANRLTQITQGSTTVSFGYDNANRRTTLTLPNGVTTTYSYDNASQLTGLTHSNGSTTLGTLTYGYDLVGRRTSAGGSFARTGLPLPVSTTAYNANNQLTTWGTANLFYDLNGNMTSDGTHSYTWDARNHLSKIDSGSTGSFVYDPFGRRASKNITGTSTSFLYDGVNAVQEVIGGSNTANSLTGGIDDVFQRTDSAGARSFLKDALGSTLALTDSTAALQTQYTFDPFGNTSFAGASTTNSFSYTGRELDANNLYYFRARYYNSQLQRFISEDPLGFRGGVHKYAYVSNSPTNFVDPMGLDKTGFFDRAKSLARCAASVSQAGSLNSLVGAPRLVGSNSIGDLAGLILGSEPRSDPTVGTNERIDQGLALGAEGALEVGKHLVLEGVGTGWDLVSIADTGLLSFAPETLGSIAVFGCEVTVGAFATTIALGKVGLDAVVFAESLAVCGLN